MVLSEIIYQFFIGAIIGSGIVISLQYLIKKFKNN